jgi:hypothetical protein
MHFVFLNQYYPPDAAPTGVMLEAVAEHLANQGHHVTVICAGGGYAGGGGANVERRSEEVGLDRRAGPLVASGAGSKGDEVGENVEHRTSNVERRSEEKEVPGIGDRVLGIGDEERPRGSSSASSSIQHSTFNIQYSKSTRSIHHPSPRILRLGATRFGRGTFVGKLLDYASYYLGVAWSLMRMQPRPDRIVALTTPPYLSVLARVASRLRGGDHAHWVMDLYPDVMAAHGMLKERGPAYQVLAGLARWGFGGKRCVAVLTLGPDMAARIEHRTSNVERRTSKIMAEEQAPGSSSASSSIQHSTFNIQHHLISWVPLWSGAEERGAAAGVETAVRHLREERGWADDELVVMYSGNMGLGHRFGEILAVAGEGGNVEHRTSNVEHRTSNVEHRTSKIMDEDQAPDSSSASSSIQHSTFNIQYSKSTRFVFFGGGKRRGEIEDFMREHPGAAVELHDYAPAEILVEHLRSADVHLASLDAAWTGTMVPSKLQGIFAVGRPVVFIGSADSSIGRWVAESGGGWVVEPGDVEGLRRALEEARDPAPREARGAAAERFAARFFDKATNVARSAEVFLR